MNERKQLKNIFERLGFDILYEDEKNIEVQTNSYESLSIEFNENGMVTNIY